MPLNIFWLMLLGGAAWSLFESVPLLPTLRPPDPEHAKRLQNALARLSFDLKEILHKKRVAVLPVKSIHNGRCAGTYYPWFKTICIAQRVLRDGNEEKTVSDADIDDTLQHEIGHALDHLLGEQFSDSTEFTLSWEADVKKLTKQDALDLPHWMCDGDNARGEAFAEMFHQYRLGNSDTSLLISKLPNCSRLVKEKMREWNVDKPS